MSGLIFIHICQKCETQLKGSLFGTLTTYYRNKHPDPMGRCDHCNYHYDGFMYTRYYKKKDIIEMQNKLHLAALAEQLNKQ